MLCSSVPSMVPTGSSWELEGEEGRAAARSCRVHICQSGTPNALSAPACSWHILMAASFFFCPWNTLSRVRIAHGLPPPRPSHTESKTFHVWDWSASVLRKVWNLKTLNLSLLLLLLYFLSPSTVCNRQFERQLFSDVPVFIQKLGRNCGSLLHIHPMCHVHKNWLLW